jgi:hypothetical protein
MAQRLAASGFSILDTPAALWNINHKAMGLKISWDSPPCFFVKEKFDEESFVDCN